MSSGSTICFGDVVKLRTTSGFADGATPSFLGFIEQGKSGQMLVVPPVKESVKSGLLEAEFIVMPVRGEKPQTKGTPLTYKTPFVLGTSDGNGYSLNNKVPGQKDGVTLQPTAVKGEMYVSFEKDGFTSETNVNDGDDKVQLQVVDSNRIRKTFNHPLMQFSRPKSDAPGGFVGCAAKGGKPLELTLVKQAGAVTTREFVKNPVFRRASMEWQDSKSDALGRAERVDSGGSEMDPKSRQGSVVEPPASPTSMGSPSPTAASPPLSSPTEEAAKTEEEPPAPASPTPAAAAVEPVEAKPVEQTPAPIVPTSAAGVVLAAPVPSEPVKTPEAAPEVEMQEEKHEEKQESAPATSAEPVATTASSAEGVISEAFTPSEAKSSTAARADSTVGPSIDEDELGPDDGPACVGKCSVM